MLKAVIFDMDGTMLDTENMWLTVNTALAAHYGAVYDKEVRRRMMGRKDYECLSAFKEYFNLDEKVENLIARRRKMIMEKVSLAKEKEGLTELLDLLDRLSVKKAVATSSFTEFAHRLLSGFDLEKRFEVILTGDEISKSKPDPEIFLEAARRLGEEPADCLVLEDAQNGVESAFNAKMRVFAIPHAHSSYHDFSKATKVFSSMLEIDEEVLKDL